MWVVVELIAAIVTGVPLLIGGTAGGYPLVRALGVTEFEGKAGYYAFFFVGVPVGVAGAVVAFGVTSHFRHLF